MAIEEVVAGVHHWTQVHPRIRTRVHSHYVAGSRTLIDPLVPDEGIEWFDDLGVERVVLSNRHHLRHAERFFDNGVAPDAWIPFGGGKRRCVGSHLAMLELRTAVAEVIRRLDVRPANPEPERTRLHHVTLTPADGGRVVVSPRRSGEAPQLRLRSPDRRARTAGAPAPARTAPAPARGPGA